MLTGTKLQDALSGIVVRSLNRSHSRVVSTATLLGMVSSGGGLPAVVTRLNPNLLYAGGPSLTGGRYTPIGGPEALYLGSSERVANAEWASALRVVPGNGAAAKDRFPSQGDRHEASGREHRRESSCSRDQQPRIKLRLEVDKAPTDARPWFGSSRKQALLCSSISKHKRTSWALCSYLS